MPKRVAVADLLDSVQVAELLNLRDRDGRPLASSVHAFIAKFADFPEPLLPHRDPVTGEIPIRRERYWYRPHVEAWRAAHPGVGGSAVTPPT